MLQIKVVTLSKKIATQMPILATSAEVQLKDKCVGYISRDAVERGAPAYFLFERPGLMDRPSEYYLVRDSYCMFNAAQVQQIYLT